MKKVRLPLDAQDQAQLHKDREGEPYVKPVLGTVSALAFVSAIYIFGFSDWEQFDKILIGSFAILFGVMAFWGIFLSLNYYAKNNADIQAGEKEVIVGTITKKEVKRYEEFEDDYYFFMDEEKLKIPSQYYHQFEEGDTIALHRAPLTEAILKIELFH
jgi:hypothetical protein